MWAKHSADAVQETADRRVFPPLLGGGDDFPRVPKNTRARYSGGFGLVELRWRTASTLSTMDHQ